MYKVQFFYNHSTGAAIFHNIGDGYYEFGEICPDFWPENDPPDLEGFTRFVQAKEGDVLHQPGA